MFSKLEIHLAANQLIKHELADTTGIDYANYRTWLYKKESPAASYERVLSYMMTGDTTRAREVQDSIPLLFDLTTAQDTEHDYFGDLLDLMFVAYSNEVGYRDYDSTTVAELETIADNSEGLSGTMTRNLLNLFYGYNYTFSPEAIIEERQAHDSGPDESNDQWNNDQPVHFIPNPASSLVLVQYDFKKKNETPAMLKAYDLNGRLMDQVVLDGKNGRIQWNVSNMERGIYYCIIERGKTLFEPKKLVLID